MKKIIYLLPLLFIFVASPVFAQEILKEESLEATIQEIEQQNDSSFLKLLVNKGSLKGQVVEVETGNVPLVNQRSYQKGDKVIVSFSKDDSGNEYFYITDYVRRMPLFLLFVIFAVLSFTIGGKKSLMSLTAMALSFLVIIFAIIPAILKGLPPVIVAIAGSLILVPLTFYLSHGFNKKTTVAVVATFISLVVIGLLSSVFVEVTKLSGFASEEASFVQVEQEGGVNIKGLLLAGIIIGALGVLDDITISQSAIVFQLRATDKKLKQEQLFIQAMNVGKDHIASMINTLILVYAGASLPLLLIFINNPHPFLEVINYEIVADEIVRTLVGSIGLILAVPITTFVASLAADS